MWGHVQCALSGHPAQGSTARTLPPSSAAVFQAASALPGLLPPPPSLGSRVHVPRPLHHHDLGVPALCPTVGAGAGSTLSGWSASILYGMQQNRSSIFAPPQMPVLGATLGAYVQPCVVGIGASVGKRQRDLPEPHSPPPTSATHTDSFGCCSSAG
jgi:hypothetical protein